MTGGSFEFEGFKYGDFTVVWFFMGVRGRGGFGVEFRVRGLLL